MQVSKKKRIIDTELIEFIKTIPCIICGRLPSDAHHLTSIGAGGDDIATNLMPLCRQDHSLIHAIGLGTFIRKYSACKIWLENAGRADVLEKYGLD